MAEGGWGLQDFPDAHKAQDGRGVGTIFTLERLLQSKCKWTGCSGKVCGTALA